MLAGAGLDLGAEKGDPDTRRSYERLGFRSAGKADQGCMRESQPA